MLATGRTISFRKAFLLIVCLKLYVAALLYLQFCRTDMTAVVREAPDTRPAANTPSWQSSN